MHRTGVALACLLVLSSCGNRWTDEQRAAVQARSQGQDTSDRGQPVARAASVGAGGTTTTLAGGGSRAGAVGSGVPTAVSSDAGSSTSPCAVPSDAPGVTDDTITVGNISSLAGVVPGLGATAQAATRAYIAYLNEGGGVCGRRIELKTADDGQDLGRFRALANELGPQVFGFVGHLAGGDDGGAERFAADNIPSVGVALGEAFSAVPSVFDINPPFGDTSQSSAKYRYLYDQGVRTAAVVYLAVDSVRNQIELTEKPLMQGAGIRVVHEQSLPLTTFSYDAAARGVANSRADYLLFLGGYDQNSNMAKSMHGTGYNPKFEDYLAAYGPTFIDLAGPAGEGVISWAFSIPAEEAAAHPEGARYLQWLGAVAPDVQPDTFSGQAWASAKAFFDALQQIPGPITREGIVQQLRTFTEYDAGGFYGKLNLAEEEYLGCQVGVRVEEGEWRRFIPAQGFLC